VVLADPISAQPATKSAAAAATKMKTIFNLVIFVFMGWFGCCFERERLSADSQAQLSLTSLG
jgi:hypothetical protein